MVLFIAFLGHSGLEASDVIDCQRLLHPTKPIDRIIGPILLLVLLLVGFVFTKRWVLAELNGTTKKSPSPKRKMSPPVHVIPSLSVEGEELNETCTTKRFHLMSRQ